MPQAIDHSGEEVAQAEFLAGGGEEFEGSGRGAVGENALDLNGMSSIELDPLGGGLTQVMIRYPSVTTRLGAEVECENIDGYPSDKSRQNRFCVFAR
jgi:hypothetical protein